MKNRRAQSRHSHRIAVVNPPVQPARLRRWLAVALVVALAAASLIVAQFANIASAAPAGPGDPSLSASANITSRTIPDDEFTMTITDPTNATTTGTTTGATTGPQTGSGEVAGPIAATLGGSYHVAETSSSGDIGEYTVAYSCVDTADPAQRVVTSGAGASFDLTFPTAIAGEAVPTVACTFTDTGNPIAGQGSDFDCSGATIYDLARSSSQSTTVPGELDAVDTSSIGNPTATVARIAQVPNGGFANALGITRGGTRAYMVNQSSGSSSTSTVHEYDATTQTWSTFAGTAQPNANILAGAIDPHNGIYYYADFQSTTTATIFGFDTATNTAIPGVIGTFPLVDGGNGDIAFDAIGNLYVVSSSGTAGDLAVVPGPLPTSGVNANLTSVSLDTYTLPNASDQYNGIAFDNAGRLFIQHLTSGGVSQIFEVNPNTGATIANASTESTDTFHPHIDLGGCSLNPVVELQKTVNSRANANDEFGLSITGGGVTDGNTATTVGSAVGLQHNADGSVTNAGPVVGVQGTTYTFTETATAGSLSNYSTSYQCVDVNSPNQTVVASGTATTFQLMFPGPVPGESGPAIICTFTNTANPVLRLTKILGGDRVNPGDQFTMDIHTGGPTGPIVNATTNSTSTGTGSTIDPGTGTTGTVFAQPGQSYYLTEDASNGADLAEYTATISCNDASGLQPNLPHNAPFPGSIAINPVAGADISCALTNTPLQPDLVVSKSVDPISTTPVVEGQTLKYTLTFDNTKGQVPAPVNYTDDLSQVVDDATVSVAPSLATGSGLTVGTVTGNAFTIMGDVPVGGLATVTYSVKVDSPDTSGNHQLDNYVVPTGTTPPSTCVPLNPLCTTNPVPDLVVTKSVDPISTTPVTEGQVLTYTLTFDNSGGQAPAAVDYTDDLNAVVDDATISSGPVLATGSGLTIGNDIGNTYRISGAVPALTTATVTYKVTVNTPDGGDHQLDNYVVPTGTTPPTSCDPLNPLCTTNPVPDLVVTKSVDPISTTPVVEGQTLTYTLTFDNTSGKALAPVNYTDDLSKVVDDATVTVAPALATGAGLTVGTVAGNAFTITGDVDPGKTATVTYSVKVDSPDTNGDHQLDNYVVPTGTTPPSTCDPLNPLCTTNPVPDLVVTKSVDPISTTPVVEGQTLTYTLTFDNSLGKAPAAVDYTDDLSRVTDDASIASDPVLATGSGLTIGNNIGDTYRISGTLPAGATATVTYDVTVDTPDVGDHELDNYVVPTGTTPPSTCDPLNPLCTTNPVPDLVVTKSVDPISTTPVVEGQTLTYTLTFDNSLGKAPAAVDYTDDLSRVTDDASIASDPVLATGSGLTIGNNIGDTYRISGTLPAGATATVTYDVTVDTPDVGDHELDNYLVPTGTTPPASCDPTNTDCTTNPVPDLVVTKSVDPISTTPVVEGQTLTYTLTFDNTTGKAPAPVDYTDDLSQVVDDATVTVGPALATGSGLTVGTVAGNAFTITGDVAAGALATVTYSVRVNTPDTGNHLLDNYVVPTGTTPPASCDPTNTDCTTNPVPDLVVTKTSVPSSTTPVQEGQHLSYTLTFDNSGMASATVDWTDYLTKVLDDAKVTTQPSLATGSGLTVSSITGNTFTVTGTLGAGATATVTYGVTVDSPDLGDHRLDNFVVEGSVVPPPTCLPSNPDCTTNPDPALKVTKSVNPASGSTVVPGQLLSYTITFDNTAGKAAAPIAWTDDLSRLLDDATIVTQPKLATGSGITVGSISDGKFTMTGSLAAGSTATVTYQAKVDDPDNGNRHLDNFVLLPGTNPPATCTVGQPLETCNPGEAAASGHRGLAFTGVVLNPITWTGIGAILMLLGVGLALAARRRRS